MAIRLIREDEQLKCIVCGVTFHYRRLTPVARQTLRQTHTSRGNLDADAFADAMLRHCVFNWEGDVFLRDTETPEVFDPELIQYLPDAAKLELLQVIDKNVDGKVETRDPS